MIENSVRFRTFKIFLIKIVQKRYFIWFKEAFRVHCFWQIFCLFEALS